jgi:hypothetical protein
MAFVIKGKVRGDKEVVQALNRAEPVFVRYLAAWLQDERARFVGGKNSKGRTYPGFRTLLASKRLKGRPGTWSKRVAHLFKGYMPMAHRIGDLVLTMGVGLQHPVRMHRALWFLAEGGHASSEKQMPIPIYRNLAEIGVTKGFSGAKAFKRMIDEGRLFGVRKGGRTFYFDTQRQTARGRVRRTKPLFVGVHSLTIAPQLTGRYDFYRRWDDAQPKIVQRGGAVVDRAVVAVERGKLD